MTYIKLTKVNFIKEVLKSKQPVLVEFFTHWSGSCHIISPILKEIEAKYKTCVKFCKINMDEQKEIVQKYGIQKIPTILFFKDGQVFDIIKGVVPKTAIAEKLKALLQPEK